MNTKRYITLAETEVLTLQEGYQNASHHQFKNRCHCLLLSNEGYDMATLKDIFNVSHPTISNWFDIWESGGIAGLRNKPGQGRKPILTEDDRAAIKAKVQGNPQQLQQVCFELKAELNKEFSTKTLTRFLKSLVGRVGGDGANL
jgi:transposase